MRPIAVEKKPFHAGKQPVRQSLDLMMLDDAEMALELIDLAQVSAEKGIPPAVAAAAIPSPDLLAELYSATGMIMDRAECESLVREIEHARRTRILAA
jgi:hypothetical protein